MEADDHLPKSWIWTHVKPAFNASNAASRLQLCVAYSVESNSAEMINHFQAALIVESTTLNARPANHTFPRDLTNLHKKKDEGSPNLMPVMRM
jgi:hypothetical protein